MLGVEKNASATEIRKAFYKKARELHPDRTEGDLEKQGQLQKVNNAYQVLSDDEKREKYDKKLK